jgi:hypothetical protein
MDKTIGTMLALILIFVLISIGQARTIVKLEKDFDVYKKMVKKMCRCHPWKEL